MIKALFASGRQYPDTVRIVTVTDSNEDGWLSIQLENGLHSSCDRKQILHAWIVPDVSDTPLPMSVYQIQAEIQNPNAQ